MLNNLEKIEALKAMAEVMTNAYDHQCITKEIYIETIKGVSKELQDMLREDYKERNAAE